MSATTEFQLIADLQPGLHGPPVTREAYDVAVDARYCGKAAWVQKDARLNWSLFAELKDEILPWLEHYRRDPGFRIWDKWYNGETTLTGMCWLASKSIPALLDFEENYQTFFLRRGLIEFLKLTLREIEPLEAGR